MIQFFFKALTTIPSRKKTRCQSEDPIGMGSSNLPIVLGKMADFGERKENAVSKKEKPSYQSFSLMLSYQKM